MDSNVNGPRGADLRTDQLLAELKLIDAHLRSHGFERDWDWLYANLSLEKVPATVLGLAVHGRQGLAILDRWVGTRFADLAEEIDGFVVANSLNALRKAPTSSPTGAQTGGRYEDAPLASAMSAPRSPHCEKVVALFIALALEVLRTDRGLEGVKTAWHHLVTAIHVCTKPTWALFLSEFQLPEFPESRHLVIEWAKNGCGLRDERLVELLAKGDILRTHFEFPASLWSIATFLDGGRVLGRRSAASRSGAEGRSATNQEVVLGEPQQADSKTPELRSATIVQVGQDDESETGPKATAAVGERVPADEPEKSDGCERKEVVRIAFRTAVENQRLWWHWDSLLPHEVQALIDAIERGLDGSPGEVPALIFGMSLVSGVTPKQGWCIPISDGNSPGIDLRAGQLLRELPRPPNAWKPDPDVAASLACSAEMLRVRLPRRLADALRRRIRGAHKPNMTLGDALEVPEERQRELLDRWLDGARHGVFRLTIRRIARALEIATFAVSQRAVLSYCLAADASTPPPSAAYYTAATTAFVGENYRAALQRLWIEDQRELEFSGGEDGSDQEFAGSRLLPSHDVVRGMVEHLRSSVPDASTAESWERTCAFHNAYVAYVVRFLEYATGHRPVNDPFDGFASISHELGWALLNDKQVGVAQGERLVPLGELAARQIAAYLAHLEALYFLVPPNLPELAQALAFQLGNARKRVMPLFFRLKPHHDGWFSVSPSWLAKRMPEGWRYPNNLARHLLPTWCLDRKVREDAVAQMMGHVDHGTENLSLISPLSPDDLLDPLRGVIDAFLEELGWTVESGLTGSDYEIPKVPEPHNVRPFGSAARAEERERLLRADIAEVDSIVASYFTARPDRSLTKEDVGRLQEIVRSTSKKQTDWRLLRRLDHLRAHLRRIKREHELRIEIPAYRRVIVPRPSLYDVDTLVDADAAQFLRRAYLDHLDRLRAPLDPKTMPAGRAAHAIFALVAFGFLVDRRLIDALLTGRRHWLIHEDINQCHFFEVQVSRRNIRRFPVPPLVAALLHRTSFYFPREQSDGQEDQTKNDPSRPRPEAILEALAGLVGSLIGRRAPARDKVLGQLIQWFDGDARLTLPGVCYAHVSGRGKTVSLPRSGWLRWMTDGQPIRSKLPELGPIDSQAEDEWDESDNENDSAGGQRAVDLVPEVAVGRTRLQALEFVKWIRLRLRDAIAKTKAGTGKRPARIRKELAVRIRAEARRREAGRSLPPIAAMLGRFVFHLCTEGSVKGKPPQLETIRGYFGTVAEPLVEAGHEVPFAEISDSVLEDMYAQVLESTQHEEPLADLKCLRIFHWAMRRCYDLPQIDWGEVVPEDFPDGQLNVDAGVLTFGEYRRALKLLLSDEALPDRRDRLLNGMCLFLMFSFGLRTGEALLLRARDLVGVGLAVRVCNNQYRKVKTDAALRAVPLMRALDPLETEMIREWCTYADYHHGDDALAALLAGADDSRMPASRWRIESRVVDAIHAVTGDAGGRKYHARHAYASRLFSLLAADGELAWQCADAAEAARAGLTARRVRKTLTDSPFISRRGIWGQAVIHGHAYPGTTGRHYIHVHDLVLARWLAEHEPVSLTESQLRNALAVGDATMYRWRGAAGRNSISAIVRAGVSVPRVSELVDSREVVVLPEPRFRVAADKGLSLELVVRILEATRPGVPLERVCSRLLCSEEDAGKVLSAAIGIVGETLFGQPLAENESLAIPDPGAISATEWEQLIETARIADRMNRERLPFERITRWWRDGFVPRTGMVIFNDRSSIDTVCEAVDILSMPRSQVMLAFDEAVLAEPWCAAILACAKGLKLNCSARPEIPYWPGARTLASRRRRVGLMIREEPKSPVRSQRCFSWMMFALATWSDATKKPASE